MTNPPKNPLNQLSEEKSDTTLKPLEFGFENDGDKGEDLEVIKRTAQQNAQARLLLIQLQWLLILLMFGAILWLANSQKQLEIRLNERLKVLEEFTTRMNTLDDRIFAMTPTEQKDNNQEIAQNDLGLVKIQLASADRLYHSGDYKDALEMLKAVQFHLIQDRLNLAAPLKSALKSAIDEDIRHIDATSRQTDAWQTSIVKMREVQAFLKLQEKEHKNNDLNNANMLLSLAIGAATMKDRDTTVVYLGEALTRLEPFKAEDKQEKPTQSDESLDNDAKKRVMDFERAVFMLNEILANPPTLPPLKSSRILK